MKRLKSNHYLFIIFNLLGIVFEYFLLYQYFLVNTLNLSPNIAIIITSIIFVILLVGSFMSAYQRNSLFEEIDSSKIEVFQKEKIDQLRPIKLLLIKKSN